MNGRGGRGAAAVILLLMTITGCATQAVKTQPTQATGDAITQTGAYITSASTAVKAAQPHADATGQGYLGSASSDLTAAQKSAADAKADLSNVSQQIGKLNDQIASLTTANTKLTHSWGYQLQVWVTRLFWALVALIAVHFIAAALTVFVPTWAPITAIIANIVNPLGWLNYLVGSKSAALASLRRGATA